MQYLLIKVGKTAPSSVSFTDQVSAFVPWIMKQAARLGEQVKDCSGGAAGGDYADASSAVLPFDEYFNLLTNKHA